MPVFENIINPITKATYPSIKPVCGVLNSPASKYSAHHFAFENA